MGQFRSWLKESVVTSEGIFAQALPVEDSHLQLIKFCDIWGITPDADLHCTLMYSKQPLKSLTLPDINRKERWKASGVGVKIWKGYDQENFLILLLESPSLHAIHDKFVVAGILPTVLQYQPHVTLVHPVNDPKEFQIKVNAMDRALKEVPMELTFRWGGIDLT